MVQAFPSNRADQPLGECILPGTSRCGDHFFYAQRLYATTKLVAVDRITVANQIMHGIAFCKGFHDLLSRPFGGRVLGDAEVKHSSPLMLDYEEYGNTNNTRRRIGGTVKKSTATISPMWFGKKVLQVCDGGRLTVHNTRDTVRSETVIPSFCNSP